MTLLVTVKDLETGHQDSMTIPDGDYGMIAHAPCYYEVVAYPNGTHVITVKGRIAHPKTEVQP